MFTAAIITASDKGYARQREDVSGRIIEEILCEHGYQVLEKVILPDDKDMLKTAMVRMSDTLGANLILTTGGTGFSPRDITPEATSDVCERMAPGVAEAIRADSMKITGRAMLSRAVCGIRGSSVILNLPGSPKAVKESLLYVIDHLEHGLDILLSRDSECAQPKDSKQ